jgi:hypothetical protein
VDWLQWRTSGRRRSLFTRLARLAYQAHAGRPQHPDTPAGLLERSGITPGSIALDPLVEQALAAESWKSAVLLGLADAGGRPFASLPDPFEPLLAIWDLGCAVEDIVDEQLVLVIPATAPPATA